MPPHIACSACSHEHRMPDRAFDPESGTTACPECGAGSFEVLADIQWHG